MDNMKTINIFLIFATSLNALYLDRDEASNPRDGIRPLLQGKSKKHHQLQIDRETGLDGKVRSIRLDTAPKENVPGIRAFGFPRNKLIDTRIIDKVSTSPVYRGDPRTNYVSSTYGPSKLEPENNSRIELVPLSIAKQIAFSNSTRLTRSIDKTRQNDLDDLLGEEAKVFRPLFVYRQQMERRLKQQNHRKKVYEKKYNPRMTQKPRHVYRYPNRHYY